MYLIYFTVACSGDEWSTRTFPLDQYQEKLTERRRKWEKSHPVQPSSSEKEREIQQLTHQLHVQGREKEHEQLQEREQRQLAEKERHLQERGQEIQELQRQIQERG